MTQTDVFSILAVLHNSFRSLTTVLLVFCINVVSITKISVLYIEIRMETV